MECRSQETKDTNTGKFIARQTVLVAMRVRQLKWATAYRNIKKQVRLKQDLQDGTGL